MGKHVVVLLLFVTMCPVAAFAQGRRGGFGGGGIGGGARAGRGGGASLMDERTILSLFTAILTLSDAQQQQLRAAFDAAVVTAAPIATQLANSKEAVFEAVKAGKSDDQVKMLSAQEGSLSAQMLALQAQTFSKMWAILNTDQKPRMDDLMYDDIGQFLANATQPASPGTSVLPNAGAN
jgi:Spy/CpxP family protein refolding chaperone